MVLPSGVQQQVSTLLTAVQHTLPADDQVLKCCADPAVPFIYFFSSAQQRYEVGPQVFDPLDGGLSLLPLFQHVFHSCRGEI